MIVLPEALFLTHLFFRSCLGLLGTAHIDLLGALTGVSKKLGGVIHHVRKAAGDDTCHPGIVRKLDPDLPGHHRHRHIAVMGHESVLPVQGGQNDLLDLAFEKDAVTAYDIASKKLTHVLRLAFQRFCLFYHIIDGTDIEECRFRILIHLTVDDGFESADGLL